MSVFDLDVVSLSYCKYNVFILVEHIVIHAYIYNMDVLFGCPAHGEQGETPVRVGLGCSLGCV